MVLKYGKLFSKEELNEIRGQFKYVDDDCEGTKRLFFDNAGGSLRLIKAEQEFGRVDILPDCPEHSNKLALYLADIENKGRQDIKEVVFNAKSGVVYPNYTASMITGELTRILSENTKGTNNVTTALEHPSAYDAIEMYSKKYGRELRVAPVNTETGGVDAEAIIDLIDENTAILCCMAASNISGYIYDIETIFKRAREINPNIYIYCDAVQHAPHASLDPEKYGVDVMNYAPYKYFGVRGFGIAYVSDRVSEFEHNRLLGKPKNEWDLGSPCPAHYAAVSAVVDYVVERGKVVLSEETNRRKLFELGMSRIADHERGLLEIMLEGTENTKGLRHIPGVTVHMDEKDLSKRDLILCIAFDNIKCQDAVIEYEKRNVVTYERISSSIYSKRMLEPFGIEGVVRLSPLHVNSQEEMEEFLRVTQEISSL